MGLLVTGQESPRQRKVFLDLSQYISGKCKIGLLLTGGRVRSNNHRWFVTVAAESRRCSHFRQEVTTSLKIAAPKVYVHEEIWRCAKMFYVGGARSSRALSDLADVPGLVRFCSFFKDFYVWVGCVS